MEDGCSGTDDAYNVGVAHRLASGSSFAANYAYGWSSPESASIQARTAAAPALASR
jgi:hypothetical protein